MSVSLTRYIVTPVDYPEDATVSTGDRCCWGCTLDTRAALCAQHGTSVDPDVAARDFAVVMPLTWDAHLTADGCGHIRTWFGCTDEACAGAAYRGPSLTTASPREYAAVLHLRGQEHDDDCPLCNAAWLQARTERTLNSIIGD